MDLPVLAQRFRSTRLRPRRTWPRLLERADRRARTRLPSPGAATIAETTGALQEELVMNVNATSLKPAWRYGLAGPSLPEIHRGVSRPAVGDLPAEASGFVGPGWRKRPRCWTRHHRARRSRRRQSQRRVVDTRPRAQHPARPTPCGSPPARPAWSSSPPGCRPRRVRARPQARTIARGPAAAA